MRFSYIFTITALFAAGAFATPIAEADPTQPQHPDPHPKPPPPPKNNQQNQCGNGATPYCCNTDGKGAYTTCSVLGAGSTCGATTVCCNAQNSIQLCLGTAQIG